MVLARLVGGRRGLDHSQAPDCQIVDLDLAKMHFAEVGPQDRQSRDGKRTMAKAPRASAPTASAPVATAGMRTGGNSNSCRRKSRIVVMRTYLLSRAAMWVQVSLQCYQKPPRFARRG